MLELVFVPLRDATTILLLSKILILEIACTFSLKLELGNKVGVRLRSTQPIVDVKLIRTVANYLRDALKIMR